MTECPDCEGRGFHIIKFERKICMTCLGRIILSRILKNALDVCSNVQRGDYTYICKITHANCLNPLHFKKCAIYQRRQRLTVCPFIMEESDVCRATHSICITPHCFKKCITYQEKTTKRIVLNV